MVARRPFLKGIATVATAVVCALAVVAPAAAATQVGETFDPAVLGGSGVTDLQSGSPGGQYTVPFDGVITSWSFQAPASNVPKLKFKVGRSAGGNNFVIVGEDGPRTPVANMLNTFPTHIPVQAGDVIGDYRVTSGLFARSAATDYSVQTVLGDPAPGTTTLFNDPSPGFQLDVSAMLHDNTPPNTKITKLTVNSAKHKATLRFKGTDPAPSSLPLHFKCKIDKKPYGACSSPKTYKHLKVGKHKFRVKARDAAGNVDPTPAVKRFTIKP